MAITVGSYMVPSRGSLGSLAPRVPCLPPINRCHYARSWRQGAEGALLALFTLDVGGIARMPPHTDNGARTGCCNCYFVLRTYDDIHTRTSIPWVLRRSFGPWGRLDGCLVCARVAPAVCCHPLIITIIIVILIKCWLCAGPRQYHLAPLWVCRARQPRQACFGWLAQSKTWNSDWIR